MLCQTGTLGLIGGCVEDGQSRAAGGEANGDPDALPDLCFGDIPEYMQDFDLVVLVNGSHEVDLSFGQREFVWEFQVCGQMACYCSSVCLRRRASVQRSVMTTLAVLCREQRRTLPNSGQIRQTVFLPDKSGVILMETFDAAIALGMVDGRKDQLHATIQRQTDDLSQHVWVGVPAAKAVLPCPLAGKSETPVPAKRARENRKHSLPCAVHLVAHRHIWRPRPSH